MVEMTRIADTTADPTMALARLQAREAANAWRELLFPEDDDG